jgi:hypothetical protein
MDELKPEWRAMSVLEISGSSATRRNRTYGPAADNGDGYEDGNDAEEPSQVRHVLARDEDIHALPRISTNIL